MDKDLHGVNVNFTGLIAYLFSYFGVPIILLAVMISITVSFGIISGSIFAAVFSLYVLIFIKSMGEPVKCKLCLVIKVFLVLSVINFILAISTSGYIDKNNGLNIFSLSVLPSIFLVVIFLVVMLYLFLRLNSTPPRLLRMIYSPFRILHFSFRKTFLKVKTYDQAYSILKNAYNYACNKYPPKTFAVNKFISISKKIATKTQFSKNLAYEMAFYTSGLLVKSFEAGDDEISKKLFYNYVDNLYPNIGGCGFRTNIIGNSLNLAINTKDDKIADIIFSKLLGKNFKIEDIPNDRIIFNLACYYSLHGEKEKMLEAVHFSLKSGRKKSDFLGERDFKQYWNDSDFLKAMAEES